MNLLIDRWIPVRPVPSGKAEKISLKDLLCGDGKWEIAFPRDDMELAGIQLAVCMTQALLTPKDSLELKQRIANPLSGTAYDSAALPIEDWFRLDHPKHPFMQVREIKSDNIIPMESLLAGLTGATNSCFVNDQGIAERLCGGCAAIALFNQASCAPSFGGGFKAGLRSSAPVTTLVQGRHMRETVWLNVLSEAQLDVLMAWYGETRNQKPTWIEPIRAGETILSQAIGLVRGLLWQPANVQLLPSEGNSPCSCCGFPADCTYSGFVREKFNFTVAGTWPHPHSPRVMSSKNGKMEEKFVGFKTSAPSWTQLSRFVVRKAVEDGTEGQQPAGVVMQVRDLFGGSAEALHLLVGGYRNNQASVLERRHDVFTLNHGWDHEADVINEMVLLGGGYRDALKDALRLFMNGLEEKKGGVRKKISKGIGPKIKIHQAAEGQFYRRSEPTIQETLARIDFMSSAVEFSRMRKELKQIVEDLFDESVRPYLQDPELIRTMAIAKRMLRKRLGMLEPQMDAGGTDGTAIA